MTVQKISVCVRPTQDKGGREACQKLPPTAWCRRTCILEMAHLSEIQTLFSRRRMLDFGAKEISRLTYKHRLLFYFSLFPHTGGRVNKMLRLQWTGGLWRRLWEMKRAPLYRICAFLMSAGALIHSSFLKWEAIQTSRHWEAYIGNQNLFCTLKNTCLLIVYIEEKVLLSILF